MALIAVNSRMLCDQTENFAVSQEKEQFIERLVEVCTLLNYPERGRQTQLAERYKLAQPSVGKWFNGKAMPSYEIAADLCKRAMVNYDWLMTGRPPKFYGADQILDPDVKKGLDMLVAMEPSQRPYALRLLDVLVEPKEGTNGDKH